MTDEDISKAVKEVPILKAHLFPVKYNGHGLRNQFASYFVRNVCTCALSLYLVPNVCKLLCCFANIVAQGLDSSCTFLLADLLLLLVQDF